MFFPDCHASIVSTFDPITSSSCRGKWLLCNMIPTLGQRKQTSCLNRRLKYCLRIQAMHGYGFRQLYLSKHRHQSQRRRPFSIPAGPWAMGYRIVYSWHSSDHKYARGLFAKLVFELFFTRPSTPAPSHYHHFRSKPNTSLSLCCRCCYDCHVRPLMSSRHLPTMPFDQNFVFKSYFIYPSL